MTISSDNQTSRPRLQPPGAGLPLMQKILLRVWVGPFISKRANQKDCRKNYEMITRKLIEKVESVPLEKRMMKVLVPPQRGLEDSSRYWSLNEVLEHLLIVSRSMEKVILSLASGATPKGKADTAAVKPGKVDHDLLEEFKNYSVNLMEKIDSELIKPGMNLSSRARFRHPWFGEINAIQWYWLLSMHQGLHYQQAKAILSEISNSDNK